MHATVNLMIRTMSMLGVAAAIGVAAATFTTCGVGLAYGTGNWCALPFFWFLGIPVAALGAIVFGLPLTLLFRKLAWCRWWQYGVTGLICAIPAWMTLAQPFTSVRWTQSGLYDSLNCLGSGLAGGLAYWWISRKVAPRH